MKKKWSDGLMVLGMGVVSLALVSRGEAKVVNRTVAVVNGEIITSRELEREYLNYQTQIEQSIRQEMVVEELLKKAREKDVKIDLESLKKEKDKITESFGSREMFQESLRSQGLTEQDYEEKIKEKLLIEKLGEDEFKKVVSGLTDQKFQERVKGPEGTKKVVEWKKKILSMMTEDKLKLQQARKAKVKVTQEQVNQGMAEIRKRFSTDAEFKAELGRQGITEKEFTDKIKDQLLVIEVINREIKSQVPLPAEQQVKDYYNQHRDQIKQQARVHIRHILFKLKPSDDLLQKSKVYGKAQEVKKKLEAGEDFTLIAQQYSEDEGSRKNGGDLGYIARGEMVTEFENAAFNLGANQISEIIETRFGYHILKCEGKVGEKQLGLDDKIEEEGVMVEEYLRNLLWQTELEKKYGLWLDGLKKTAKIEIKEQE